MCHVLAQEDCEPIDVHGACERRGDGLEPFGPLPQCAGVRRQLGERATHVAVTDRAAYDLIHHERRSSGADGKHHRDRECFRDRPLSCCLDAERREKAQPSSSRS